MKKHIVLLLSVGLLAAGTRSQVKWADSTLPSSQIAWDNYSTSYMGDDSDSIPLLVSALPYNGMYDSEGSGGMPLDMTFTGSAFRFQSGLGDNYRALNTYDSGNVYFLAPGIFRRNAAQYEFRVLQNGQTVIKPWSDITTFTDSSFGLNNFKPRFAFLGGYSAPWDNYVQVELRKKGSKKNISAAVVYWKQARPVVSAVFTANEWNELLLRMKQPYGHELSYLAVQQGGRADTLFGPKDNSLMFLLGAVIYKKEALEYELLRNGKTDMAWKHNDLDNNFIWLKNLRPGKYSLHIRYRKQRHNVTEYVFEITPAWYQTLLFKLIAAVLVIGCIGSIVLLFRLVGQRRRTAVEQAKKEKLLLELKSIQAQLNPHFIFNALSSIQGLINKNDIAGANQYLSDFGTLVRGALTGSDKSFIPLDREIGLLRTYLTLEQLRFGFSWSIDCEPGIPTAEIDVPSLLLQPLVENAVKHGVSALREKGVIGIRFSKAGNDLLAVIGDNGPGFSPLPEQGGYGLKLTRERIAILNAMPETQPVDMHIGNRAGQGTTIEILFKNRLI